MEERLKDLLASAREHIDPDAVTMLAQLLVSVPSHTPEGEERVAAVLEQFLQQAGIATTRQQVDDAGVNVIATLPSESEEIGLLLNGHLDIVPPSSAMPYPPFDATIEEGRLWGRGTADMKGGVAAMACALAAIRAAGIPLRRTVMFSAVASEEQGCRGTATLVRHGVRAMWAVVGEPTGLDLVIAHKGVDRYQVIVEGRAAHESMPERGVNAIVHAAHLITVLDTHLFPSMRQHTHPLLGHATYNIGTIEGGISRNMVPDWCMFRIAKRWLPGDSPEAIRAEIEAAIRTVDLEANVSVIREPDVERVPRPPLELPLDHPLTRTLAATVTHLTGRTPAMRGWAAFSDGALLQAAGIPTVIFGPGDLGLAHSDEEHIPLSDVITAAEVYTAFAIVACSSEGMVTTTIN
jgi:acetylornithine deacetylase/succinyl-diaminopimelate desuccinylase family protein